VLTLFVIIIIKLTDLISGPAEMLADGRQPASQTYFSYISQGHETFQTLKTVLVSSRETTDHIALLQIRTIEKHHLYHKEIVLNRTTERAV